jgi:hypothetical protein
VLAAAIEFWFFATCMAEPNHVLAADVAFATFVGFVGIAVTTEAALGFGSVLVALTLGATLYPVATLLPLLVCMNVMLTSYIVARHHRHVAWRVLLTRILPAMAAGMTVGYNVFVRAPDDVLKTFLGIFVVLVAAIEIKRLLVPGATPVRAISGLRFGLISFAAGVVHGITATGGPVLVYAVNRLGLDKTTFRTTMCCVWLTLNSILIVTYAGAGRLGAHNLPFIAALAPMIAVAIGLGEWLHDRLDPWTFRLVVLIMLLVAGVALLV